MDSELAVNVDVDTLNYDYAQRGVHTMMNGQQLQAMIDDG